MPAMSNQRPAFDNSYARLPESFYRRQPPIPVSEPRWIARNDALAQQLNIDTGWLASDEALQLLAGNATVTGTDPIATVYAGHQFGQYNPQLGDGRAVLLGELLDTKSRRVDMQLKGSGPTPYSRGGDGRSPMGPVIREYLLCEAMHALGIPSSRALAAVSTGEPVYRQTVEPGAILTRVASSHIRIGTMQFFAALQDKSDLQNLIDYTIQRHYPVCENAENPTLALLQSVMKKIAGLVAAWQGVGFIHGVMNTDNMLLCGETIDYGPCAFMDSYAANTVYSSIDHHGRYAYGNQPAIAHWNLAMFAQALLPCIDSDGDAAVAAAQAAINDFPTLYGEAYAEVLRQKFGFSTLIESDNDLFKGYFELLEQNSLDFTLSFRKLTDMASGGIDCEDLFEFPEAMQRWLTEWQARRELNGSDEANCTVKMTQCNPMYIPRNHQVAKAISDANKGDYTHFETLLKLWQLPFSAQDNAAEYALPPQAHERVLQTFCGT